MILYTLGDGPDEERDTDRRKSPYASARDIRFMLLVLAAILLLGYFFWFRGWKARRDFVVSKDHLREIFQALGAYAADNADGLPAAYAVGIQDALGNPVTWANQLFDYTARMSTFSNPTCPPEGDTPLTRYDKDGKLETVRLSYGLLSAAAGLRRYQIRDDTLILSESISSGVMNSYDPLPLKGRDGFLIGYDNSNGFPDDETRFVTRVAFTGGNSPDDAMRSIHPSYGTVALRADGSIAILAASSEMRVGKRGKVPFGPWVP